MCAAVSIECDVHVFFQIFKYFFMSALLDLVEGDDLEYGGFDGAEHDTDPDETEGR